MEISIRTSRRTGAAILALLPLLAGRSAAGGVCRSEFFNRSAQAWHLTLVEGTRERLGQLEVVEKFSGKRIGTLARTGDDLKLPAGARYLVAYVCDKGGFFQDFVLEDGRGHYAEYTASLPDQSEPAPVLSLRDQHVGPPLDQATEAAVQRAIADKVNTDNGNLIIVQDFL